MRRTLGTLAGAKVQPVVDCSPTRCATTTESAIHRLGLRLESPSETLERSAAMRLSVYSRLPLVYGAAPQMQWRRSGVPRLPLSVVLGARRKKCSQRPFGKSEYGSTLVPRFGSASEVDLAAPTWS